MSLEWNVATIGELCSNVSSGGTPKSTNEKYYGGDIPWLNTKEINFNRIYDTEKHITKEGYENSAAKWVKKDSVIVAMYGATAAKVAMNIVDLTTNQACCNLTIDKSLANPKFVYYYLYSNYERLLNLASGAAQQNLNSNIIKEFPINIPSLNVQNEIVNLLSTIDDKIELNHKINKNLEQLCHILFKYYFIDFVPFNNNKFINSEIGEIPNGWNITSVGDILDCKLGGTPSRSNDSYWGGDIAWINSGKVNEFRIIEPSEYITDEGLKKSATKLLPAKTTVIAITGATLGQISLLEIDSCANQSVIGIIPNNKYPYEFVYPLISSILIDLLKHQTGGAQQHINKNNLESFNIICPPVEVILKYKNIVHPLYAQLSSNCFEIQKLTKLRDTLLPKLMSGEIDVSKINCDLKIIIRKIYIKSSKLFLWRYLSENQNHIKNTKSNETLLKSRTIYQINKFLAKFNARYRYYRQ